MVFINPLPYALVAVLSYAAIVLIVSRNVYNSLKVSVKLLFNTIQHVSNPHKYRLLNCVYCVCRVSIAFRV